MPTRSTIAVSLVVFLVVTFGAAGVAFIGRGREGVATGVGIAGLAVAVVAAVAIDPEQTLLIGGAGIAASEYVRLFLILGSLVGLALAVVGLAAGSSRDAPAVMLGTLGGGGLALSLPDPRIAVLAATAGGLGGVLLTLTPTGGRIGATVGIRDLRPLVIAGAMAIAATAWIGRDLSQLAAQPVVFGLRLPRRSRWPWRSGSARSRSTSGPRGWPTPCPRWPCRS